MILKKLFKTFSSSSHTKKLNKLLTYNLTKDLDVQTILKNETQRQLSSLELIASENFTSRAVLQANGTI